VDGGTHGVPKVLEPEGLSPLPEIPLYVGGFRSDVCLGLMGSLGDRTSKSVAPVALALAPSRLAAASALASAAPTSTAVATAATATPPTLAAASALASAATASSSTTATPTGSVGDPEIKLAERQREVGQEGHDGEGQDEDCLTLHDASHAVCLLCRSARSVGTNQRTRVVGHDRNLKQAGCQREGRTPITRATRGPLA